MITTSNAVGRLSRSALLCASLAIVGSRAGAQADSANHRWLAWVGCWQAAEPGAPSSPIVCIVPSSGSQPSSVDVVTVDSGKVLARHAVDASGQQHAVDREGCTGWEKAQWSRDSLRVFLRSELTCRGSLTRSSSGVMSISPNGDWLDVRSVRVAGNEVVRAVHYRDAGTPNILPAEIASAVAGSHRLDTRIALILAGARLTASAIVEASAATDTLAVQAWLIERHQQFNVDARTLVAMADAGVPGSVTDVMVALAYPDEFHFGQSAATGGGNGGALTRDDSARIASSYLWRRSLGCDPLSSYSPYDWGWGGGANPCDPFNAYRYGYGLGYGYGRYGYGSYGYGGYGGYGYPGYSGYYSGPLVIVKNPEPEHGRAVKGQGYTRASSSSSSGSTASRSEGSASGSAGGSSSSGSSGSSSSASSSSAGRTAHSRP